MINFVTETEHNIESLLAGKSTFSEVFADEGAMIESGINKLAADLQPAANILYASLKDGASALVGAGKTALGPILAESSDAQATQVLNILSAMGVPTGGVFGKVEQAALITGITGLKTFLDRIGLHIMTASTVAPPQ